MAARIVGIFAKDIPAVLVEIEGALAVDMLLVCLQRCLLYTSDAADERSSVDLGGRRIIKKKKKETHNDHTCININE